MITGANGQIGTVLTESLQEIYGNENVIATDLRKPENENSVFEELNVLDGERMQELISKHKSPRFITLLLFSLQRRGEQDQEERKIQYGWPFQCA
ncbi:MAG: NAD-dependent epimerase/dehydratase family protein [Saprospiraceae bacterium]